MYKHVLWKKWCSRILLILILIAFAGIILVSEVESQTEKTDVHVIVLSQDEAAEIEVKVDGKRTDEVVSQGINYLPYKTEKKKPVIKVLAYGDTYKLKPRKEKNDEWYTFLRIDKPRDGDGKDFDGRVMK